MYQKSFTDGTAVKPLLKKMSPWLKMHISHYWRYQSFPWFISSMLLCWFSTINIYSSGGIAYHSKITKTGSKYLRWIMLEYVHAHIRTDKNSNITRFYERLSKRKGAPKAAIAAAPKLLSCVLDNERKERVSTLTSCIKHIYG